MAVRTQPEFDQFTAASGTIFIPVPIENGRLGGHLAFDATFAATTIALEVTSWDENDAPLTLAASNQFWPDYGGTAIAAVTAGSVGSRLINVANMSQKRARLRIVLSGAGRLTFNNGIKGRST